MKNFDKKLIILTIFLFVIACIALYFFTRDNTYEIISENEFITNNTNEESLTSNEIVVHIDGEVINPGIVLLPANSRISDAILSAGGATEIADISKINLAYILKDGQKIYVPSIYDTDNLQYIQNDAGTNIVIPDENSHSSLVNINLATQSELETLPGIGPSTASKIIDYRNKNGKFKTIEDIMNISGIGESKFANIKDYICI